VTVFFGAVALGMLSHSPGGLGAFEATIIAGLGIVLLAGVLLLVSGSLPAEQSRLGVLRDLLPLSFIEVSHLVGSIAGLFLIVVARGRVTISADL
jgi:lysylphosphatidylglycerol synthetase-like protein (DUF2156 family)